MVNPIFNRAELLLGSSAMAKLEQSRVIIFGVGGVGSWCAESLVRTGVGHLTLVDSDKVSITNVNRQMMATTISVGEIKVEALRRRLLEINPEAEIVIRNERYEESTADSFNLDNYDCVVDCIDSLKDKALLILRATSSKSRLFSSMGAALKIDPSRISTAEFWKVKGCPLARALRQRFKKMDIFPKRKFLCVFSDELVKNQTVGTGCETELERVNGSLMHITAIFGLTLASHVIKRITSSDQDSSPSPRVQS